MPKPRRAKATIAAMMPPTMGPTAVLCSGDGLSLHGRISSQLENVTCQTEMKIELT